MSLRNLCKNKKAGRPGRETLSLCWLSKHTEDQEPSNTVASRCGKKEKEAFPTLPEKTDFCILLSCSVLGVCDKRLEESQVTNAQTRLSMATMTHTHNGCG